MSLLGIIASSKLGAPTAPVAGYTLWLDAADTSTITASGGDVSQWDDKSGNASNFTQGTGASQPKTGTRTINSKNVIDFDGTNDFLECPSSTGLFKYLHSSTGATTFIVGVVDNNAASKAFFSTADFASTQIGIIIRAIDTETTGYTVVTGSGTAINVSNVNTLVAGTPFYLSAKIDPGNGTAGNRLKESLDGASFVGSNASSGTPSSSNSSANARVGDITPTAFPYDGGIAEIIIYSGILSSGDILSNQQYLAAKWGI